MASYDSYMDGTAQLFIDLAQEPDHAEIDKADGADEICEDEKEVQSPVVEHFDDAIKLYLREIQKTKLLTAQDERELALKIEKGDKAAREKMIVANLRLVVKMAKRYMNRGLPFLDLIEEGNLGLIKAVERFKISKECRFSTYATWWIRQSIERALVNQSRTVRLPVHISDDINRMLRVSREFVQQKQREPSLAEVAEVLGVEVAQVRRLMVLLKKTYSMDQPIGDHSDYYLTDTIEDCSVMAPDVLMEGVDSFELVSELMETFSDAERKILTLRFGLGDTEPQTLDTIGQSFGVTRERIRQIEAKALQKLRTLVEEPDQAMAQCG